MQVAGERLEGVLLLSQSQPSLLASSDEYIEHDGANQCSALRDTIAWSSDLLPLHEQALFRRLAVFAGGCTLEVADSVTNPDGTLDVLDGIASLADKSLLRQVDQPNGEPRFTMLETIREYALERLVVNCEADDLQRRHANAFLALAEVLHPQIDGPHGPAALAQLEAEHPNLRAALGWLRDHGEMEAHLRLVGALSVFWGVRGYHREAIAWLGDALEQSQGWSPGRRGAFRWASALASNQGDHERGVAYATQFLALAREHHDTETEAVALFQLSYALGYRGESEQAAAFAEEAVALFRKREDAHWIPLALNRLGVELLTRGEYQRAAEAFTEALALWRSRGVPVGTIYALTNLGITAHRTADYRRAAELYRESLLLCQELGERRSATELLALQAAIAGVRGQPERAAKLLGASDAIAEATGVRLQPYVREITEPQMTAVRARIGEKRFAAVYEAGRALPLEEAIADASSFTIALAGQTNPGTDNGIATSRLTTREQQILRLIAEGRSDREIAEVLFISRRTVNTHVTGILNKLGVSSRSAAVAVGVRDGLA